MSTDKSAAAIRELVERWMGKKHPITMQSYVSDLTALISEHYVAKEEVDKMVAENLIEFGNMIRDEPNGDIAALAEYFIRTINLKTREK